MRPAEGAASAGEPVPAIAVYASADSASKTEGTEVFTSESELAELAANRQAPG